MSTPALAPDGDDVSKVQQWRFDQLVGLYPPVTARLLAEDSTVDLHRAVELAQVCDPQLAAAILL